MANSRTMKERQIAAGQGEITLSEYWREMDSLSILPLSIIPLETASLKRARLIKGARLESLVELFHDRDTGSGVVPDSWWKLVFSVAPDHDGCSIRRRGQAAACPCR